VINKTINPILKHIDIRYYEIRELVKNKTVLLKCIKLKENLADVFTKCLNSSLMTILRNNLLFRF